MREIIRRAVAAALIGISPPPVSSPAHDWSIIVFCVCHRITESNSVSDNGSLSLSDFDDFNLVGSRRSLICARYTRNVPDDLLFSCRGAEDFSCVFVLSGFFALHFLLDIFLKNFWFFWKKVKKTFRQKKTTPLISQKSCLKIRIIFEQKSLNFFINCIYIKN